MPTNDSPIAPAIIGGVAGGAIYFAVALVIHALFDISDWLLAGIGAALILFAAPKIMNAHIVVPVMILTYLLLAMTLI